MNIFKVMASARYTMPEIQLTAILAWLLHPQMEHGLGYEFLSRFLQALSPDEKDSPLSKLTDKLAHSLGMKLKISLIST